MNCLNSDDFRFMIDELLNDYAEQYHEYEDFDGEGRADELKSMTDSELVEEFISVFQLDGEFSEFRLDPKFFTDNIVDHLGLREHLLRDQLLEDRRAKLVAMIADINLSHDRLKYADLDVLVRAVGLTLERLHEVEELIKSWN